MIMRSSVIGRVPVSNAIFGVALSAVGLPRNVSAPYVGSRKV